MNDRYICATPVNTFKLGEQIGRLLEAGDVVLLSGSLGAGKTLFTKGILRTLGFNIDDVTSPSFTLVNLYRAPKFDVYHIDLWRLDAASDPAGAVGLSEILEKKNAVTIIEWADRLGDIDLPNRVTSITIQGDGDESRRITVERQQL